MGVLCSTDDIQHQRKREEPVNSPATTSVMHMTDVVAGGLTDSSCCACITTRSRGAWQRRRPREGDGTEVVSAVMVVMERKDGLLVLTGNQEGALDLS